MWLARQFFLFKILFCNLQGFKRICEKGALSGHKVSGVRFVVVDG